MAEKLIKEQQESNEVEKDYCTICYCNEIDREDTKSTVVFDCGHVYCSECTLGQLKNLIDTAELDKIKCFAFDCENSAINE